MVSLRGQRHVQWLYLPSVECSGGIIIIWDPQVLELVDSHIGTFSVCCKLKSLSDNFIWGPIGGLWSE